ncbi:MAG TPA: hypothetical protein VJL60_02140, partial [Gammaproteobacteria bacterium]|nr:hypothetical protein [Gammaproteobacteria bacterium]
MDEAHGVEIAELKSLSQHPGIETIVIHHVFITDFGKLYTLFYQTYVSIFLLFKTQCLSLSSTVPPPLLNYCFSSSTSPTNCQQTVVLTRSSHVVSAFCDDKIIPPASRLYGQVNKYTE